MAKALPDSFDARIWRAANLKKSLYYCLNFYILSSYASKKIGQ